MTTLNGTVIKLSLFGSITVGRILVNKEKILVGMINDDFPSSYLEFSNLPHGTAVTITGETLVSCITDQKTFRISSWNNHNSEK